MRRTKEIWVPAQYIREDGTIEVYSNYEVSNLGRVKSLGNDKKRKEKILTFEPIEKSNGTYHYVNLSKNNRLFKRAINRLVMSSFDPAGYFHGALADHINSTPGDDRLENLRWLSKQRNNSTEHCKKAKIRALTNRKDLSKQVKVTFPDGHTETFLSAREAGRVLCMHVNTVSCCINQCNGYYRKRNLHFQYV